MKKKKGKKAAGLRLDSGRRSEGNREIAKEQVSEGGFWESGFRKSAHEKRESALTKERGGGKCEQGGKHQKKPGVGSCASRVGSDYQKKNKKLGEGKTNTCLSTKTPTRSGKTQTAKEKLARGKRKVPRGKIENPHRGRALHPPKKGQEPSLRNDLARENERAVLKKKKSSGRRRRGRLLGKGSRKGGTLNLGGGDVREVFRGKTKANGTVNPITVRGAARLKKLARMKKTSRKR